VYLLIVISKPYSYRQQTKDSFVSWILNDESQNMRPNPINNVKVAWHLFDAFGNMV
jgi:hypothetical protein